MLSGRYREIQSSMYGGLITQSTGYDIAGDCSRATGEDQVQCCAT